MKIPQFRKWCKEHLIFFGPGLLLAITAAGEAGITEALEIGAHFGLTLTWVIIITLLFKYAFTTGIARYTLATGKTIFEGIAELPGPKNWGSIFIIFIYLLETVAVGAMALYTAIFLEYLISGSFKTVVIAISVIVLALLLLRTHIYHKFEVIMAILVVVMSVGIILILTSFPFTSDIVLGGLIPSFPIPKNSETSILAIIGVVGSGLNLMLYSVWMEKKIRTMREDTSEKCILENQWFFNRFIKSVKIDIKIGFVLVFLITLGFMALGFAGFAISFMPHGAELTLDCLLGQVSHIMDMFPGAIYIFLGFMALIFFGAITVGIDARATAITKVVKKMREASGKTVKNSSLIYNIALLGFLVIMVVTVLINEPMATIRIVSIICALLFGALGFILLYLNSKLPEYARGSRIWMLFIGLGSVLSIYVGLLLQGSILDIGLPLVKNLLLCLIVFYLFTKTKMFRRIVDGEATLADKFWLVFICGAFSIYGTIGGNTDYSGYLVNFRDFGPMIAGILGGPIVGVLTGVIGGVFRLTVEGGELTAIPCCASTILAGLLSGMAVRMWKGKLTAKRLILLVAAVECLHLIVIIPVYGLITQTMAMTDILSMIGVAVLPMILVNAAGLYLSAYFNHKKVDVYKGGLQKTTLKQFWKEFKEMFRKGDFV
ncbi:MAG TPA: Nramp family divalent metal transporter [Methanocorpusculum sp.]|nr:Nramp family divalent metal transporter [Methanocorpusculum sp.]